MDEVSNMRISEDVTKDVESEKNEHNVVQCPKIDFKMHLLATLRWTFIFEI